MDRKALEDRIVDAVRPILEEFRNAPSQADAAHAEAIAKLEESIAAAEAEVIREALQVGLAELKKKGPEKEDRSADEAKAWSGATRRLRVATRVGNARRAAGRRVRQSRRAVEEAAERVKDVLEDAAFHTRAEIAEKTDMAEDLLKAAIARLKRDGEIESNGERGRRGGYRKASGD